MASFRIIAPLLATFLLGTSTACKRTPPFPSDQTVEGAYARVTLAIYDGHPAEVFAYLEDEAQWAAHTIARERSTSSRLIRQHFPKDVQQSALAEVGPDATADDGKAVFLRLARERGWLLQLRKDLSGAQSIEHAADRAVLVTARGTRYPFHRRTVGIWGLTQFTAELVAEAERATRDRARIESAAADFRSSGADAGRGCCTP